MGCLQVVGLVVAELVAVVEEETVVVVEVVDRFEGRGRRIRRTVVVAPAPKPEEYKQAIISIEDHVDRESGQPKRFSRKATGNPHGFYALSGNTRFTRLHPSLVSSGKFGFRQRKEKWNKERDSRPGLQDLHELVEGELERLHPRRDLSLQRLGK